VVPLKIGDKVVGCLYIGRKTAGDFSP